jgi:Ca2+-binding RTX toxin-like protein
MIGTKNLLTLLILISLILPLPSSILKFAAGEMKTHSQLIVYNHKNSKNPFLTDSENTIIKPKVQVSIEGTPNDDQLKGGEGDDKISGEDGNDTIMAGKGNDNTKGGKGDDIINGELGNDTLQGGSGDDKLNGEDGNDLIEGGKGDDMLLGGKGDDGMLGDEGNDVLNGGEGVDIMAGGLGNDTFICDQFDTIIDFNLNEGDKIVGQCSINDLAENETSYDNFTQKDFQPVLPPPSPLNPNNLPREQEEELKMPPPQPQPKPKLQSPPPPPATFSHDDKPPEDFGSFLPVPVPPSNEKYFSGPFFN